MLRHKEERAKSLGCHQAACDVYHPAHSSLASGREAFPIVGRDPVQAHLRCNGVAQSHAVMQTCLKPPGTFHPSLQALAESPRQFCILVWY